MSDSAFNSVLNEVDSFSYNQCIMLMTRFAQALQSWASKDDESKLLYFKSNMAHLERGIKALNDGKGVELELIELDL